MTDSFLVIGSTFPQAFQGLGKACRLRRVGKLSHSLDVGNHFTTACRIIKMSAEQAEFPVRIPVEINFMDGWTNQSWCDKIIERVDRKIMRV